MMLRQQPNDEGFSTIEALASFVILVMVLTATLQLLSTSVTSVRKTNDMNRQHAVLEELRSVELQRLLKDAALTQGVKRSTVGQWSITLSPMDTDRALFGNATESYGTIYHVKIEKISDNPSSAGSASISYNSFRIVPRQN